MPQSIIDFNKHLQIFIKVVYYRRQELLSQEGTRQGDPLSMPFYAVSTYILIIVLQKAFEDVKQVWLADDASAAGKLVSLHEFFTTLIKEGKNMATTSMKRNLG